MSATLLGAPATESLERVVERIVTACQPDKIILFGSRAHGEPDTHSDYDLLIVTETTEPVTARWQRVRRAVAPLRIGRPIEPIVLTRSELSRRLEYGDQFIRSILSEGVTIYDRSPEVEREIQALIEGTIQMSPEESPIPDEWHELARRDLGAARALLRDDDEFLIPAAVLLQQAVEKYIKGFLLSRGWILIGTHDLSLLLADLTEYEPDFVEFQDMCDRLSKIYRDNRYAPAPTQPIRRSDIEQMVRDAEALVSRIRQRLSPAGNSKD